MCGIAGIIGFDPDGDTQIRRMTRKLAHRGPDAEGFFSTNGVYLGHQRLSIIDLDNRSNQPFFSASGRFVLVFNGEIYNYQEVAKLLRSKGVYLRTKSDTEVIVEAFELWGVGFVHLLVGMFAMVLHDLKEGRTYFFRDRLGKKPLYIFRESNLLLVASELKALLVHPLVQRTTGINRGRISTFLKLGYLPGAQTFFQGIEKFPAGSYGIYCDGELVILPYWRAEHYVRSARSATESEAFSQLNSLLDTAVQSRLVGDVPIGVFLSGGIDSSLVTTIAAKHSKVKTFSIGFSENKFDESRYAKEISDFLGTEHVSYQLMERDAMEMVEKYLDHFDEPFADTSAIPTMLVSQLASREVKVALTGDGGDELFLGYGAYQWADRFMHPAWPLIRPALRWGLRQVRTSRTNRIVQLLGNTGEDQRQHIFSQEQYFFSENELLTLLKRFHEHDQWHYREPLELSQLAASECQAFFDLQYYLRDDLLVKVDRSSMAYGLECRNPLLDHRLVEFAINLPVQFKKQRGITKYLLKKVLYQHVPKKFFDRPKWGFSVPMAKWLRGDLDHLLDYLSPKSLQQTDVFNEVVVQNLLHRFLSGDDYLYNRLWVIIVIQRFLRLHEK